MRSAAAWPLCVIVEPEDVEGGCGSGFEKAESSLEWQKISNQVGEGMIKTKYHVVGCSIFAPYQQSVHFLIGDPYFIDSNISHLQIGCRLHPNLAVIKIGSKEAPS